MTGVQTCALPIYNPQGWCQGHEDPWLNDGILTIDGATDSMECSDIELKSVCDCGPLPGCHWNNTNTSIITGTYCSSGVPQCNLNTDDLTYKQCEDAPNQSECNVLSNTYFMPCIFNSSGTDKCEFDWQGGGGFGDNKGGTDFDFFDLESKNSCEMAGGFWKTVEIDIYGNTESWCEFGFGQNIENCDDSCWACEYQDNGTVWVSAAASQSACGNSTAAGGSCQFSAFASQSSDGRWGWCDFPAEMNFFGGGNCESSCFDCFGQSMCSSSQANCTWVDDPMGFGPGWCDPAAVAQFMNCTTNAQACMGQAQCQNAGHNWTNDYVTDPFTSQSMWICIANGTAPEICFIPGDEDNDGDSDCADSNCSMDPMCGFGMGNMGPGGPGMGGGMMLPPGMDETLCFAYDDTNQSACEAKILKQAMAFNGSHRGDANLPEHLNNTQICFYHPAPPGAQENFWCDPIFDQQMMGGMDMGKPPVPIGEDASGDADGLDYLDIIYVGIKDDPQTMDIGLPMKNMSAFAICNDKLGGTSNGTVYRYIDSDNNASTGCIAANRTYDGFDYKLVISSTYNGSDASTITAAYRCIDSDNDTWKTKSASLTLVDDACFASPPPFAPEFGTFNGVNVLMFTKSDFGIATSDLRIMVTTAGPGYNESNVTDQAGPFYYTPGSIDFMMEDCFGFVDMDGDGLAPDQDPDCKFIKSLGFIPFEDCGNNFDDNGDGLTDCNDPMCSFTPKCTGTFNFAADASDTTAPDVIFHKIDEFNDGAFVMFDTNEPANGTVLFYYNNSGCSTLNKTINDLGDPAWTYDDYKPFHHVPIDNFAGNTNRLGYDLVNGSTYFYKYKVCDPSSNCATSACSNFTTKKSMSSFFFGTNVPSGFGVPNPWGTGNLSLAKQINSSAGKDQNLTINCPTSGYSLTLVGVDVKSAKEIDLQSVVCDADNDVIGMDSDTWNQLLFDLSVDSVIITWNTGGTSATIQHCSDANGTTSCKDVTTYLDCTVTSTTVTCKIPVTLGFSSYKLSTSTTTTTLQPPQLIRNFTDVSFTGSYTWIMDEYFLGDNLTYSLDSELFNISQNGSIVSVSSDENIMDYVRFIANNISSNYFALQSVVEEVNKTISNATVVGKVVVGQPVKWRRFVTESQLDNLILPKKAKNIKVKLKNKRCMNSIEYILIG